MASGNDTILVERDEWKRFLQTVTALVKAHNRLLNRSKSLRATRGQVSQKKMRRRSRWELCVDCGRQLGENARFCDRCGREVVK